MQKYSGMRTTLLFLILLVSIYGCGSGNSGMKSSNKSTTAENNTIRIANDSLEYEIIIVEPGFNSWLLGQPSRGHYGQSYLETKNRMFVSDYNNRVLMPARFSRSLYTEQIDYDPSVDYGYEVNYMLYNYFVYFQEKYDQHLTGGRN